ncbi:MAG: branched-chain amino acid ABC transporter permease [Nitrososphaerales archaeon]
MALALFAQFIVDLLAFFAVYMILSVSLNLEFGYTGVPNFGKVLLVAGGAYVVAAFSGRFSQLLLNVAVDKDFIKDNAAVMAAVNSAFSQDIVAALIVFFATIVLAAFVGGALGYLASYPAVRLREDYLGMTLLAIGEISRVIGQNYEPIAGGTLGVQVPDPFAWAGEVRFLAFTLILLAFAGLIYLYAERIARSPLGRLLRSIRDNELSAEALGKDATKVRIKILIVGSAIAGVAGALYSFYAGGVVATAFNRVDWTFWPWLILIIGGAANNVGVAFGSFIFITARRVIEFYKDSFTFLPFDAVWLEYLLLGSILILVLIYRPEGLIPEKATPTISNKRLKALIKKVKDEADHKDNV